MSTTLPPNLPELFLKSLINWGGWHKLICGDGQVFAEPVSETIADIGQHQSQNPPRIGKLKTEEWASLAEGLPHFLNAYLQQEMHRILEPSGDLLTALKLVDNELTGRLLLALIIVAREHPLDVEVSYKSPYSTDSREEGLLFSSGRHLTTFTIRIAATHGEEHLPLVLHYHGAESVWDKDSSLPQNPVWVLHPVDRKAVVTVDGMDFGSITLQQRTRDEFLAGQGFAPIRFSPRQLQHDLFACAVEAFKMVSGKVLPPPEVKP